VTDAIHREIAILGGPIQLGLAAEQRDLCLARLTLLERSRHLPEFPPTLIEYWVRDGLIDDPASHPKAVDRLVELSHRGAILLGPADRFVGARPLIVARDLPVIVSGTPDFALLRIQPVPKAR
jgi:hypothetical protein